MVSLCLNSRFPALVFWGPELVMLYNEACLPILGDQHPLLLGQSGRLAGPALAPPLSAILEGVLQSGEPAEAANQLLPVVRSGGPRECYFTFWFSPIRGESGGIDGVFTVVTEVTEQVLAVVAQSELAAAQKSLESALHERKQAEQHRQQLLQSEQQARADAEVANRSKEEFLAMLGHELRNPLAPILTALQLMRLRGDDSMQKERTLRTMIERQVGHMVRLVDDLLDVSRITRGKITLAHERLELAEVVTKAIEMASPLIEQRRHRLMVVVPRSGLAVDGDAARLAQVAANLLTNAAKYTEPQGEITVTARRDGSSIELRVRDTGIGLSAELLPRVFELFFQQRQAPDRAPGGLGLGLTIVRSLVDLHGGSVSVTSQGPGLGSEFVVRLPAAASDETRPPDGPNTAAQSQSTGVRVLIIDDNVDACEVMCESLQAMGYQAEIAHDGPAALRLAADFRPDIVLLDIGLPVMDGYEVARHLRGLPGLAAVPLVAVTGYGQDSDRRRSLAAGFDGHLVKPLRLEELRQVLDPLRQRPR